MDAPKQGLLVFDTETTGLPPQGATWEDEDYPAIVQIAWIYNGQENVYLIKPNGWEIPKEAEAIHGISTKMCKAKGKPFEEVMEKFLADAQEAECILGHNVRFDVNMVRNNVKRFMSNSLELAQIALHRAKRADTMFAKVRIRGKKRGAYPKLVELHYALFDCDYFAHSALHDCRATLKCALELEKRKKIDLNPINFIDKEL